MLRELRPTRGLGFVLYGGTAVALHLGHRESIDFDFFGSGPLDEEALLDGIPSLRNAITLQREPRGWSVQVDVGTSIVNARPVKLSFFGELRFGRVGTPGLTDEGEVFLASPLDLLGHKLKVLLQRVEAKDYRDIAALLRSGLRVETGLGAAVALFGPVFPPADALRALTYFDGGDLSRLNDVDRKTLLRASSSAGAIELISVLSSTLAP